MNPLRFVCVSSAAAMGPRAKAEPDCYKPTGGPVAAASLAPDAELARRQEDWAWCWSTACQASRGGSNHRAGVGMTTESLARDGRGGALRDRSGHSPTEDPAAGFALDRESRDAKVREGVSVVSHASSGPRLFLMVGAPFRRPWTAAFFAAPQRSAVYIA